MYLKSSLKRDAAGEERREPLMDALVVTASGVAALMDSEMSTKRFYRSSCRLVVWVKWSQVLVRPNVEGKKMDALAET